MQCNCHNHATSCTYNRSVDSAPESRTSGGGGVCACQDNTAGRQCNQCARRYYRDVTRSLTDRDVCLPCNCVSAGVTDDGDCVKVCTSSLDNLMQALKLGINHWLSYVWQMAISEFQTSISLFLSCNCCIESDQCLVCVWMTFD